MIDEKLKAVIAFAIDREEEAVQFYQDLQGRVKFESFKDVLRDFEDMEKSHIRALEQFEKSNFIPSELPIVESLSIAEYIVDVEPNEEMDFQDIIIIAMKREEKAENLYRNLAETTENRDIKNLFLRLANEEAKHKIHFEKIYDEEVLKEN
ncbi:MAG: ferritin family protein [Ignavibacteriales bacterium]|nr:ferritin family protein [Ignavibacteriales bacterium]